MLISLIVAMDEKRGIGHMGRLPWRLPDDLKRFKQLTMGHHLIMGRKTFESVGRVLPGRTTIVVSRNPHFSVDVSLRGAERRSNPTMDTEIASQRPLAMTRAGCLVASSLEGAFAIARERGESEVFVCGGGEIYARALPLADRLYLTVVHTAAEADVFFPELDLSEWREIESTHHTTDEKNQYPFTWKVLESAKTRS